VGKKIKVLFEKPGRDDGQLIGKSEYLHAVHVTAPTEFLGTIQPVIISDSVTNSLAGKLI
ncbi:MAG: TRAM domain-containing protein, partial [Proteobacteria bacterium]|nr:TRAM domain-containing protein [Pseudomonadota bacterium]